MLNIGNNFNLNSRLYLDSRQIADSLEALQNKTNVLYPPGFEVYCKAEKKWYQNTADEGATPIWTERPVGTGGGGNANIDDNNIGTDVTYSNQKIENRLSEVNAEVTNVADDLIDMDTRVSYLEEKQLEGVEVDLTAYQKITDNTLETENKTVPGAINEINEIMLIAEEQTGDITVGEISVGGSSDAKDILITDEGGYYESTNIEGALQEVGQSIQTLSTPVIEQVIEPEELDMPRVFFYGDALPTSKTDVLLTMDYISNTDRFSSYIKLKCQGTSSMSYAKKNFTINMYSDEARETKLKKNFKGWGNQSKFCLKANWVDSTHTRNISGARIGYDMVASRPDSAFKQQLLTAPRNGLVDGFPIKLYFNGEFHGIYTWNIPKDGWMFNMDKDNPNHIVLCAEKNTDGNSSVINSCQFRQLWDGGGDWSYEFGTASDTVKNSLNRCISFVMNATDQEFHDNISEYFDLYSLLDYYCFSYLTCHLDGLAKNMLMITYDGIIWGASLYDMDSIYGVHWNGNSFVATNYQCPEQYQEQFSRLWVRIEQCFGAELYARYLELRRGALSLSNIIKHVEEIYDVIPDRVFDDEKVKWTNIPQVSTNTMTRFRNYMRDRVVYVDAQMLEIGTRVACTSITLDQTNIELTADNTTVTLVATVEPSNTTDTITWTSNATSIATVSNGLVTAKANGSAIITVTCGSQSATCNVTVTGMSEGGGDDTLSNYTSIYTLDHEIVGDGSSVYVDTGIPLMSSEYVSKDWTILVDYTPNTIATDNGSTWIPIVHCMYEANGYPGISFDVGATNRLRAMLPNNSSNYAYNGTISSGVRTQFVVTKSGNTFTVYDKTMTQTGTNNPGIISTHDMTLLLMAYQTTDGTKGRFNNGTLHRFALVEGVVSTEECQEWIDNATTGGGDTSYTDVEYIESSGTQYIDTGIVPTTSTKIEFVADMSFTKMYDHFFGADNFMKIQWFNNSAIYTVKKTGQGSVSFTSGKHTIVMDMTDTTNSITIDGVKNGATIGAIESTTYPLLLLSGYKSDGSIETNYCGVGKIYSCKIWEGDTLVRDMKPVLRNDGVYGLLDTVNNVFYSSPVGNFTGDSDITATAEYYAENLVFDGVDDYIDTGIQLFDTAKDFTVYIDYTPTDGATQSNQATVFHCIHEASPYRGLTLMIKSLTNPPYMIGGQASGSSYFEDIDGGNHKYLIEFTNGVINSIKTVDDSNNVIGCTILEEASHSSYAKVTENLLLGCYQSTTGSKGRFWNGTINKFGVWFKTLTNDEIKNLTGCNNVEVIEDSTIETTYTNGYIARSTGHISGGNVSLGEIITTNTDITSDFIPCVNTDTFTLNVPSTQYGCGVVAYDSSQSYLYTYTTSKSWSYSPSNGADITGTTVEVNNLPENTAYIRICANTTDSSSVTIIKYSIVYY